MFQQFERRLLPLRRMNACSEYMNLHVFTIVNTIVLLGYTGYTTH